LSPATATTSSPICAITSAAPDFARGKVIGCLVAGEMRGAVELQPLGAVHSGILEATFSLEQDWQCRQRALLLRTIRSHAKWRRIISSSTAWAAASPCGTS
jgi:hypothetical protein